MGESQAPGGVPALCPVPLVGAGCGMHLWVSAELSPLTWDNLVHNPGQVLYGDRKTLI
jgi:hypothetical protein